MFRIVTVVREKKSLKSTCLVDTGICFLRGKESGWSEKLVTEADHSPPCGIKKSLNHAHSRRGA
jgi:hypothetical protein